MRIHAEAIVTNEYNQALFVLLDNSRTWTQPGGTVARDELPTGAVAREVEEETGLKVKPVRLVGTYYRPEKPDGLLLFSFRCIQRGGQLAPSGEPPRAGFMDVVPPPKPILNMPQERLQRALHHAGGPPYWGVQRLPAPLQVGRRLAGATREIWHALRDEEYNPPADEWQVGAFVVLQDEGQKVLWVKRTDYDVWNLPGGRSHGLEPPWETAIRETKEETGLDVDLTGLTGVYSKPAENSLLLTFTAKVAGGKLRTNDEAADFAYFAAGEEPPNTLPRHIERAADALSYQRETIFRKQPGLPADLQRLAKRAK